MCKICINIFNIGAKTLNSDNMYIVLIGYILRGASFEMMKIVA